MLTICSDHVMSCDLTGSLQPVMEMMVSSVGSGGVGDISLAVQSSSAFSVSDHVSIM